MKYEEMSNFEISCEVASIVYGVDKSEMNELYYANKKSAPVWGDCRDGFKTFDINNPSDAWPIIIENEISIEFLDGGYVDVKLDTDFGSFFPDDIYQKERTFEAAMICFLKMKGAEVK